MLTDEQEKYLSQLPEQDRDCFKRHMVEQAEYLPKIQKRLETDYENGYAEKGEWGDYFSYNEAMFEATDSEGQRMLFRHGTVFDPNNSGSGMWIYYQKWSLYSKMQGPILMSDYNFENLIKYYKQCKRRQTWWHRIYWRILGRHIYRLSYRLEEHFSK